MNCVSITHDVYEIKVLFIEALPLKKNDEKNHKQEYFTWANSFMVNFLAPIFQIYRSEISLA